MAPINRVLSDAESAPEKPIFHNGDKALDFLRTEAQVGEGEDIDESRLLRKIDWMIVPLMFMAYFLQYLDKSLLNYAAVMGIEKDAGLTTEQYGTLSLIFYVAFLAFELPHAYMLQRLPVGRYLGSCICCWGAVVACTSACNSYGSLVATRFLLGVFESAISPSLILITSMWYKRNEQPKRVGFWYIGVGTATVVGSLMSFGFQHYNGASFKPWQIMFLVIGLITVAAGILVIFLMPNNPMSAKRLTHAERVVAVSRLRENHTGVENKTFKLYQVGQCFIDPQTWLLSIITIAASIPNGAVSSFQSILIKSFGFTNQQSALLQIPSGVIAVISVLTATWAASKYNARAISRISVSAIGGLLGGSLLAFLPDSNRSGKLAGNYLTQFVGAFLPCAYSFAAANAAGHTKKTISVANRAQWIVPLALQLVPGTLLFIGMFFCPESPRWLARTDDIPAAEKILTWLRRLPSDHEFIQHEISEIVDQLERRNIRSQGSQTLLQRTKRNVSRLFEKGTRNRLGIGIALMFLQSFTGVNIITYYAPRIFESLGVTGTSLRLFSTGFYGIAKTIGMCLFTFYIVESVGRRNGLLWGAALGCIPMWYIGGYSAVADPVRRAQEAIAAGNTVSRDGWGYLAIVCVYINAVIICATWQGITWTYASEIFPLDVRMFCVSLTTAVTWLGSFTIARSTPYMISDLGYGAFFFFFAAVLVLMGIWAFWFVPETKDVSLEEMDALFARPVAKTVWCQIRGYPLPLSEVRETSVDEEKVQAQTTYIESKS